MNDSCVPCREGAGLSMDLGVLATLVAAGAVGLFTESIVALLTVLFGAAAIYVSCMTPRWVAQLRELRTKPLATSTVLDSIDLPNADKAFNLIRHRRSVYPKASLFMVLFLHDS